MTKGIIQELFYPLLEREIKNRSIFTREELIELQNNIIEKIKQKFPLCDAKDPNHVRYGCTQCESIDPIIEELIGEKQ